MGLDVFTSRGYAYLGRSRKAPTIFYHWQRLLAWSLYYYSMNAPRAIRCAGMLGANDGMGTAGNTTYLYVLCWGSPVRGQTLRSAEKPSVRCIHAANFG